ncbi:MAG: ABC transporter ATP-binding protein [Gammaproteobacteria bacterium]|nr:MAG: ABC transporter ATP-binding protein [Gammaproteobacteria bacterium]
METLLRARQLTLAPRLKGLSLTLHRGEALALLGVNGAGKSTALSALAGTLPGVRGRLEIAGTPLQHNRALRRHIGWLPQHAPLYPELTVEENLRFFAGLQLGQRRASEATAGLLQRFELDRLRGRLAGRLSGGERMRLGLACVLAHEPEVLLLDEPTAGLDPLQAERLRELIHELAEARGVLIATHLLPDVERLCDRALLLHEGEIVAEEPIGADCHCLRVAFERPPDDQTLLELPGVVRVIGQHGGERLLELSATAPSDLLERVAARGWGLTLWHPQPSDLLARFRALSTGEMT